MKITVTCRFADRASARRAAGQLDRLDGQEREVILRAARNANSAPKRISYPTVAGGTVGAMCGGAVLALPTMALDFGATAMVGAVLGGAGGAFFGKLFDIGQPYATPFRPGAGEHLLSVSTDSEDIPRICALLVEYGGRAEETLGSWMVPMRAGLPPLN